jgi:uncharacterized protein with PIN domain
MTDQKFICDRNLGKLARWLRFLGFSCIWNKNLSKEKIVNLAIKNRLLILTRNKVYFNRNDHSKKLLIKSDNHLDQLKELNHLISFDQDKIFTKCPNCNSDLIVQENKEQAWRCTHCNQEFWNGTHTSEIKNSLKEILTQV